MTSRISAFIQGLREHPITALAAVLSVVVATDSFHDFSSSDEVLAVLLLFSTAAIEIIIGAVVTAFFPLRRILAPFVTLILVVALGAAWYEAGDITQVQAIYRGHILITAFLTLALLPALCQKVEKFSHHSLWRWMISLMATGAITLFTIGVTAAAVQGLFSALEALFSLKIDWDIRSDITLWSLMFSGLAAYLSLIGNPLAIRSEPLVGETWLTRIGGWIFTPIASIYFLVLIAYAFKIVITSEWPSNVVGYTAFGHIALWTIVYFATYSHLEALPQWVGRTVGAGIAVSALLALVALSQRLMQYGLTIDRYIALVLWSICFLIGLYIAIKTLQRFSLSGLLSTLLIACLVLLIGPWSLERLPFIDQVSRAQRVLAEKNLSWSGLLAAPESVFISGALSDLYSAVSYIETTAGSSEIEKHFWREAQKALSGGLMDRLEKHEPLRTYVKNSSVDGSEYVHAYNWDPSATIKLPSSIQTIVTLHYSAHHDDTTIRDSRVILDNGMMVDWSEGYISVDLLNGTRLWTEPKTYFLKHASSIRNKWLLPAGTRFISIWSGITVEYESLYATLTGAIADMPNTSVGGTVRVYLP